MQAIETRCPYFAFKPSQNKGMTGMGISFQIFYNTFYIFTMTPETRIDTNYSIRMISAICFDNSTTQFRGGTKYGIVFVQIRPTKLGIDGSNPNIIPNIYVRHWRRWRQQCTQPGHGSPPRVQNPARPFLAHIPHAQTGLIKTPLPIP